MYCPTRRPLASFASGVPGSRRTVLSRHALARHPCAFRLYVGRIRSVDLAIYADELAGEAAALAARAERARSRLRQAAIEREARAALPPATVEELESLGLLRALDERAARAELRELEDALAALEELQAWVEARLAAVTAA